MKRPKLGDILIEMGALDGMQLQSALAHQRQWGTPLGRAVVEQRFCSADQVLTALARQTGLPTIDLDQQQLDPTLAKTLTRKVAEQHRLVPIRLEGPKQEVLVVAIAAPASLASLDAARAVSGKVRVKGLLASDAAVDRAIHRLYGAPLGAASAPAITQPLRFDEIEFALELARQGLAPAPPKRSEVLVYGWPELSGQHLVAMLAKHGVPARLAGAVQTQAASEHDVVVAPIPSIEALVRAGHQVLAKLIAAGKNPDDDLPRAHRLGARSFLLAPLDAQLLLRAIKRCQDADAPAKLEASVA